MKWSIVIDGYSKGNGNETSKAGASLAMLQNDAIVGSTYDDVKKFVHRFEFPDGTTNNEAEVLAFIQAMNYLNQLYARKNDEFRFTKVEILSDSMNTIGWLSSGWKCKANAKLREYVEIAAALLVEHPEVEIKYVNRDFIVRILGH